MNDSQRLQQLLRARRPCVWISTLEEAEARHAVTDAALSLGRETASWSAVRGLELGVLGTSEEGGEHPAGALAILARRLDQPVVMLFDLTGHLGDARTLRAVRELVGHFEQAGGTVVLIDHAVEPPGPIAGKATVFDLSLPDEKELESIVRAAVRKAHRERPVGVDIKRSSLDAIVRNMRGLTRSQAERLALELVEEDRSLSCEDVPATLVAKRRLLSRGGALEPVESPASMDDIGGMGRLKRWLELRKAAFHDPAGRPGVPTPKGMLLLGVQGAGKSLCAKAVATAWALPLLRLDPGSLYDRFVGESERRLREALRQAEAMSPAVLWIDEIEKGFASAASHSTDGGLSQRMFGRLLTWMQERTAPVFLVATANDVQALPPELLRKGRFDEIFFVDLPDEATRGTILAIHLRRRGLDPTGFDLAGLARASEGYSGAELEAAVVGAVLEASGAGRRAGTEEVRAALAGSPPLSETMRERVAGLRAWAKGRCVPADDR